MGEYIIFIFDVMYNYGHLKMSFALHCHASIENMENNTNPEIYHLEPFFIEDIYKFD